MNKKGSRFEGRHAYITGGSSGIGLSIARDMAAAGAHVLILARNEERLKDAVGEIKKQTQERHQKVGCCPLDVTDPEAVQAAVADMAADFGPPDILVNSAGGARPDYFGNISADQFDATLRLNVCGTRNMTAAVLPRMPKPGGYIVNVASVAGLIGVFGYTDYCAAKFAVVGFSEALRSELMPEGITVSLLCPPDTDTPGLAAENATKPAETECIARHARILSPQRVARSLMRGMGKKQFLIIPGREARLSVLAKRLAPGLVARFMDHTIAGCIRSSGESKR